MLWLCPAYAVINTENLPQTLSDLRIELSREAQRRDASKARMSRMDSLQHQKLVYAIKKCNELSLMLYSQNQEYTFDMTYALKEVTREYQEFNRSRMPFDDMLEHLDSEIDKYTRLLATLKELPVYDSAPISGLDSISALVMQSPYYLSEQSLSDRDSCIVYVESILAMYNEVGENIRQDNAHYELASKKLKESYDYAQERYRTLQKKMFTKSRRNYFHTLSSLSLSWRMAVQDAAKKYSSYHFDFRLSFQLIFIYLWLIAALLVSMFSRLKGESLRVGFKVFLPTCVLGLIVIVLRILFIPNNLLNVLFPPLILGFTLWSLVVYIRRAAELKLYDKALSAVGLVASIAAVIMSWMGYVMLSVLVVAWWMFQLAAIESIMALYALLDNYRIKRLNHKIEAFSATNPIVSSMEGSLKGANIRVTWFYDMIRMAILPIVAILSLPLCILLSLDVFDLTEIFRELALTEFLGLKDTEGNAILNLSAYRIVIFVALLYVFRYVSYLAKALYGDIRLRTLRLSKGTKVVYTNEVNLTLANNVISILVWGTYIILMITLLHIPTGAISLVAAGLATGLGLAMKDILNNFIYGIQLMSGRLREGDWVDCDGVRGRVVSINYQCTQIQTVDGAEMSFLNAALFNKNFKNLTKSNPYELVKISVGVSYGTDVDRLRGILLDAMSSLRTKDAFEREIVDPSKDISLVFNEFGDSAIELVLVQFVLVSEKAAYASRARELIYNVLNKNNIEIPFPQRDIHIISK